MTTFLNRWQLEKLGLIFLLLQAVCVGKYSKTKSNLYWSCIDLHFYLSEMSSLTLSQCLSYEVNVGHQEGDSFL